ncbi:PA0061/PA0062 family lipoprotein [Pseudomonas sp.]|uniref:PA0061/PA0062 family lipoprotein n=1 Tax=Pseudomonas sp. TaxID=306 RepID=UPI00272D6CDB|nr:hypothetical protein [Pseudomonas sp.]
MKSWRLALPCLVALLSGACAQYTPAPLAEDRVRVTLATSAPAERISAHRANGQLVRGLRFDDLSPGPHVLQVRFEYEAPGRSSPMGSLGASRRSCILQVRYDGFMAGGEYRIVAQRLGWVNVGWLESASGERLVSAREIRCGPAA